MQIEQIIVRPTQEHFIVQYSDSAGRSGTLLLEAAGNAHVSGLITAAAQHLPPEAENPARSEIEQEIAELEYRLKQLKKSIGLA